jgi:hypothetical protein
MVRWAYVNNALACCRLFRCSSSSSTVSIEPNVVDSLTAISIEDLLKYPWGDKIMLWAGISPFSSDFGSRPVHTRNSGLLGNGAFMVPLPAFLPSLIIHVFRTCSSEMFASLVYRLFDEGSSCVSWCCVIDYLYFLCVDLVDLG